MVNRIVRAGLLVAMVALSVGCGDEDGWPPGVVDPEGAHYQFVLSNVVVPDTAAEAEYYSLDIDYDPNGRPDNALAQILATVQDPECGSTVQEWTDRQIQKGDIILLADLQATSLADAEGVGFRVLFGTAPRPSPCIDPMDEVCGRHLDGSGSFRIDEQFPVEGVVSGSVTDGRFRSDSGSLTIRLPLRAADEPATSIDLAGARIEIDAATANNLEMGRLGGGIGEVAAQALLLPVLHGFVTDSIACVCTGSPVNCPGVDCRPCGCEPESEGELLLEWLDNCGSPAGTERDCVVDLNHFRDCSLVEGMLRPDVDLLDCSRASSPPDDCVFDPRTDEIKDSLSLSVGFTAAKASFPLPPSISGE